MGISSHFTATYGQFNDQYLIYRHRGGHCIDSVLIFALFKIILLVPYHISYRYPALPISPNIEIGRTWSVFNLLNCNWAVCSLELKEPYYK